MRDNRLSSCHKYCQPEQIDWCFVNAAIASAHHLEFSCMSSTLDSMVNSHILDTITYHSEYPMFNYFKKSRYHGRNCVHSLAKKLIENWKKNQCNFAEKVWEGNITINLSVLWLLQTSVWKR